ncbi:hypothetical protein [Flavobacterium sp. AED]|uniref:hypothetical protein n=1 Tax=Flavobacterium sp. AED TaxID=1423323 RepID=UPI00058059F3|nr:hypothetical protein [Flavobacterium sp. AED]KIA85140.1 hypothetical protein OA85_12055 [Flavobacterium sp. AED]MDI1305779.1 hypothetical protein [bacterium]
MKSFIIVVLFLSMTITSYSQDMDGNIRMEELPGVVIKSAGKDFSIYLPDKNPDKGVRALEEKFIAYDLGKDYEGYENYLVIMETKNGSLNATYNENGKLTRVVENYKNVRLPSSVIYSVYKAFPGWQIVNDKYLYTQKEGDIVKKEYNLRIKKDNDVRKLVVNANGDIVKGM